MKIVQIAPFVLPIGGKYGGIERVVGDLDRGYVGMGHISHILASSDSVVSGKFHPSKYKSYWSEEGIVNKNLDTRSYKKRFEGYCEEAIKVIKEINPDVIHDHVGLIKSDAFEKIGYLPPILSTLHTSSNLEQMTAYQKIDKDNKNKRIFFNTVSESQRDIFNKILGVDYVVYNAVDTEDFAFQKESKRYIFNLGSVYKEKGVDKAIQSSK